MHQESATSELRVLVNAEGNFLVRLRAELVWDRSAFRRLVTVMQQYLETQREEAPLERWVAETFWFADTAVRDWIAHPSFPRELPSEYYAAALERLHDLAYWYFTGASPMQNGSLPPFSE